MNEEVLREKVAPCGLICHTCVACGSGVIKGHGKEMLRYLENFDMFAEKMSEFDPRLKNYPVLKEMLMMIADANCKGCRDGECKYPGCEIGPCAKEKGVDFCFECSDYPCDRADFDPILKAKWTQANERMKEIGAKAYFEEARERPHYVLPATLPQRR